MTTQKLHGGLGVGAILCAAFLAFVAIPLWVTSPSNVGNLVLSPVFWPYCLSALIGLVGVLLLLSSWRQNGPGDTDEVPLPEWEAGAWPRLIGAAAIMLAAVLLTPRLGLVLTAMVAFVTTAYLLGTRYRVAAVICAVVIPLILYVFFAHVAGVAIPQGQFMRLP